MTGMMDLDYDMEVAIIEKVREQGVLYDIKFPHYRDQRVRQVAWDNIGRELSLDSEAVKEKWNRLRRCFLNAIGRRRKKLKGRTPIWKHEQQMSFLLPCLLESNIEDNKEAQVEGNDHDYANYHHFLHYVNTGETDGISKPNDNEESKTKTGDNSRYNAITQKYLKRIKKEPNTSTNKKMITNINEKPPKEPRIDENQLKEMDETDMFFLSMAKMTKTLPRLEQAKIKLQLSNAVLQAQIQTQQQRSSASQAIKDTYMSSSRP